MTDLTLPCVHCRETLPLSAFRRLPFGSYDSWCKACHLEASREYRDANRDAINERRRAQRAQRKAMH